MIFAGTFRANHWQNTWSGFGFQDLYTPHQREHVMPDGCFELIIDLRDEPHRMFHRSNSERDQVFSARVDMRCSIALHHDRRTAGSSMIGVHFKPGGAAAVLGMPADALRDQVVEVDAIWGGGRWICAPITRRANTGGEVSHPRAVPPRAPP